MRALLDTHALIWAISQPERLGGRAREVIGDPSTELLASAASAWEVATKVRLRKLPDAEVLVDDYAGHLARLRAAPLDIGSAAALLAGSLKWDHRDPFDRMLAAQAMTEGIVLLTSDPAFESLPGLRTRW